MISSKCENCQRLQLQFQILKSSSLKQNDDIKKLEIEIINLKKELDNTKQKSNNEIHDQKQKIEDLTKVNQALKNVIFTESQRFSKISETAESNHLSKSNEDLENVDPKPEEVLNCFGSDDESLSSSSDEDMVIEEPEQTPYENHYDATMDFKDNNKNVMDFSGDIDDEIVDVSLMIDEDDRTIENNHFVDILEPLCNDDSKCDNISLPMTMEVSTDNGLNENISNLKIVQNKESLVQDSLLLTQNETPLNAMQKQGYAKKLCFDNPKLVREEHTLKTNHTNITLSVIDKSKQYFVSPNCEKITQNEPSVTPIIKTSESSIVVPIMTDVRKTKQTDQENQVKQTQQRTVISPNAVNYVSDLKTKEIEMRIRMANEITQSKQTDSKADSLNKKLNDTIRRLNEQKRIVSKKPSPSDRFVRRNNQKNPLGELRPLNRENLILERMTKQELNSARISQVATDSISGTKRTLLSDDDKHVEKKKPKLSESSIVKKRSSINQELSRPSERVSKLMNVEIGQLLVRHGLKDAQIERFRNITTTTARLVTFSDLPTMNAVKSTNVVVSSDVLSKPALESMKNTAQLQVPPNAHTTQSISLVQKSTDKFINPTTQSKPVKNISNERLSLNMKKTDDLSPKSVHVPCGSKLTSIPVPEAMRNIQNKISSPISKRDDISPTSIHNHNISTYVNKPPVEPMGNILGVRSSLNDSIVPESAPNMQLITNSSNNHHSPSIDPSMSPIDQITYLYTHLANKNESVIRDTIKQSITVLSESHAQSLVEAIFQHLGQFDTENGPTYPPMKQLIEIHMNLLMSVVRQNQNAYPFYYNLLIPFMRVPERNLAINMALVIADISFYIKANQFNHLMTFIIDMMRLPHVPALMLAKTINVSAVFPPVVIDRYGSLINVMKHVVQYEYSTVHDERSKSLFDQLTSASREFWLKGCKSNSNLQFVIDLVRQTMSSHKALSKKLDQFDRDLEIKYLS